MPVITSIIVIESGSTRNSTATGIPPTAIHCPRRTSFTRSSPGRATRSASAPTASANETAIATEPMMPESRPSGRQRDRFTTAPTSATAGTSQTRSIIRSPLQQAHVVHVRAATAAVHGDDDREPDDDLGGGHDHREERQDLAVQVAAQPAEGDEGEIHGVQLQLDGHEDHERVLAHEHAHRADREEHRRHDQEIGDRRAHPTGSSSRSGAIAAPPPSPSPGASTATSSASVTGRCRCARTIAAIAATMSRTDVTSNGRKYCRNSTRDNACAFPPALTVVSKLPAPFVEKPTPARIATTSSTTRPMPSATAIGRCPRRRSTRLSSRSTPSSMMTNRNRTMMAPAYTMICTANRNGAPRTR